MKKILLAIAFAVAIGFALPTAAHARETTLRPDTGITEHGPRRYRAPRRGGPHWGGYYGPRYRPGYRYYAPPRRPVYVVPSRPVVVYPSPYYGGAVICR